ncbi:GntR family transcriptional regulator [Amycolatopsis saalfeldensis]|uniref:GntR family transcriptional regulator n=1 Tax=Amycolatopsis saalfeldensis TaxID=394193 RepID=A0A1H8YG54_9PSEU|nr:GntR family transcriptional regulator [Amycolatopsis saalfeldensis]SEP51052.1 GntR family transcriptional regulator [Amycolatopsis saalfeldensis]
MPEYLYERVADALREKIVSGDLQPGDRLPSQEALSDDFGVSRIVAREALDVLENEGLIDRVQRLGAFVRRYQPLVRRSEQHYRTNPGAPFAEEALAAERIPRYSHKTYPDRASADIAHRLKIPAGSDVMRTDYTSYANDEPMMLTHSYEPLEITRGTPIERPEEGVLMTAGLVDRFTAIGLRPTRVVERLRSRMPRPSETETLKLRKGTPVVIIARTTFSDETPVETADILLDAHRFELEYVLRVESSQ